MIICWENPIRNVNAPRVHVKPLDPIDMDDIHALLNTCQRHTFTGDRDRAIILALLDTGVRAHEFLNIEIADLNIITGAILIRTGKGRKPRTLFLGRTSRRAARAYLKHHRDINNALWVTKNGEHLAYCGLRSIMRRRASQAGIATPSLHSFRRAFALNMLRAGVDVYSLQKLMGHADLQVLRRYLAQTDQDTLEAHRRGGPVDNAGL